jgi:hypothetical protein
MGAPLPTGNGNGRRPDGKFGKGNTFAAGDPFHKARQDFRVRLIRATGERFEKLVTKLLDLAEAGEQWALQMVLHYAVGRDASEGSTLAPVLQQNNYYATLTPEQQARIEELARIGKARFALDEPSDD